MVMTDNLVEVLHSLLAYRVMGVSYRVMGEEAREEILFLAVNIKVLVFCPAFLPSGKLSQNTARSRLVLLLPWHSTVALHGWGP